jgi:hypothetical protein
VSIALFFLLSGFFLAALLGALHHNKRLWGASGACLAVIACIIVFLKPVQLPPVKQLIHGASTTTSTTAVPGPPGAAGSIGVVPTTTTVRGATTAPASTSTTEAASVR